MAQLPEHSTVKRPHEQASGRKPLFDELLRGIRLRSTVYFRPEFGAFPIPLYVEKRREDRKKRVGAALKLHPSAYKPCDVSVPSSRHSTISLVSASARRLTVPNVRCNADFFTSAVERFR